MTATIQTIQTPKRWRAQDTSGNNNHGQIYSGRGLEFDGITDSLTVTTDVDSVLPHMIVSGTFTVACWLKFASLKDSSAWYASYTDGNSRVGLDTGNAGELSFTIFNGSYTYTSNITPALAINTWYRVICVLSSGTPKLYINGVERTESTTANPNALASLTSDKFNIGEINSVYFDGQMSDFQSWDAAWSADDVAFDYANPEQLALNRGGTSLTESNLKLWYPMNDGHRGQQSYVLDASNVGLGDEMLTNGDFSTGSTGDTTISGWNKKHTDGSDPTTYELSNEQTYNGHHTLKVIGSANNDGAKFTASYTAGTTYKLDMWVYVESGTFKANPPDTPFNPGTQNIIYSTTTGQWENIVNIVTADANSSDSSDGFFLQCSGGAATFYIGEVSMKPVNDKNHATTVFYGDNTIVAGNNDIGMGGTNNWDAYGTGTTESVTGGKLRVVTTDLSAVQGVELPLANSGTPVVGRTYRIRAKLKRISGLDPGTVSIYYGGASAVVKAVDGNPSNGEITDSEEQYEVTLTATDATGKLYIVNLANTTALTFEIDAVYLKEVGTATGWTDADQQLDIPQTALQSYNQLWWWKGLNQHVQCEDTSDGSTVALGTGGWSVSGWFNANYTELQDASGALFSRFASDAGFFLRIYPDGDLAIGIQRNNSHRFYLGGQDLDIEEGKWYHVVLTYSGTSTELVKLYLNGELRIDKSSISDGVNGGIGDSPYYVEAASDIEFQIGGNYGGVSENFAGAITEVSTWGTVLSQSSVNELYNDGKALDCLTHSTYLANNSALTGYWRNNGLATWSNLKPGNDIDGAVSNPNSLALETILQQAGVDSSRDCQGFLMNRQKDTNSLNLYDDGNVELNSTGSYVETSGNAVTESEQEAMTITLWFKHPDNTSTDSIINICADDAAQISVETNGNGRIRWTYEKSGFSGDARYKTASGLWSSDKWTFLALQFDTDIGADANRVKCYIGDEDNAPSLKSLDGTQSGTVTSGLKDNTTRIGHQQTNGKAFIGQIDEVMIYNRVLTTDEIDRNYNAGKRSHR